MADVVGTKKSDFIHVAGDGLTGPDGFRDNPGATSSADQIDISKGGTDYVFAGDGDDTILAGAALSAADRIDGQGGNDTLSLDGDYSHTLKFLPDTIQNIETIEFAGGHNYAIRTNDGNVSINAELKIDASALGAGDWLHFDAHLESDAGLRLTAGAGDDVITGGQAGGYYDLSEGGNDRFISSVHDGAADELNFGSTFNSSDYADGGSTGALDLSATTPTSLEFNSAYVKDFEYINLTGQFSIVFDRNFIDWPVQNNSHVVVRGEGSDPVSLDASADAQSASTYVLEGGGGNDTLIGGNGTDQLWGLGGKDTITPGGGADIINYGFGGPAESTGTDYDVVIGFNFRLDQFHFFNDAVNAISPTVSTGTLSTASFDMDLHNALLNANNGAHTAVLFTPDAGTLAGHTFLIVDKDGTVGYTAGHDFVIELVSATHLSHMNLSTFGAADAGPP